MIICANPSAQFYSYQGRIRTATSMKVTESLAQEVLSLPLYPEFETKQLSEVVKVLKTFMLKESIA